MRSLPNLTPTHQNGWWVSLSNSTKWFQCLHHKLDHGRVSLTCTCLFSPLTKHRCDEISLDGKPKPVGKVRSKYTHAQKMRASMTHIFGRDFSLGKQDWTKNEQTGRMMGNPSMSHLLGTYMVSLRNWKVCNRPSGPSISSSLMIHWFYDRFVHVMWLPVLGQSLLYVRVLLFPFFSWKVKWYVIQGNPSKTVPLQPSHWELGFKSKAQTCSNNSWCQRQHCPTWIKIIT